MSQPTKFRVARETENFIRYETAQKNGTFILYLPRHILKHGGFQPQDFEAYGYLDKRVKPCCFRDNDRDGNCYIHSAPGVLRRQTPPTFYHATPTKRSAAAKRGWETRRKNKRKKR